MNPDSFCLRIEHQRRIDRALWPFAAFVLGLGGQQWYYARLSEYNRWYEMGWGLSMLIYLSILPLIIFGAGIAAGFWLGH